jgi:microcystin-dependent protein
VQSLGVDGTTVETTYGPYRDSASIAEWGAFSKTFTVTGLDSTAVDALAAAVLAANATPRVRVNALTLALRTIEQLEAKALIDLYDEVQVVNVAKGISDTLRVTELEHAISTDKWLVRLEFGDEGAVASPVFQPPVQSGARPDVGVIELFAGPTGNIPATKLLCDGASYAAADYPHLFAVIGYVFGGSGDFFNVPNLVDRFPIGAGTKALGTSGGASTKTLTSANLPPHAHSINHAHQSVSSPDTGGSTLAFLRSGNTNTTTGGGMVDTHAGNSGNGPGTSTPVDVMNPWLSINYVIRAA